MANSLQNTLTQWAEISTRRSMYEFGHFLRANGISMPQIMLLMHLHHSGSCAVSDISRHLEISKPAASQLIQRLVEQDILDRREGKIDRRVKEILLTDKGHDLIHAAIESRRVWIEDLAEQLPIIQQTDVESALTLLIQAANKSGFAKKIKENLS